VKNLICLLARTNSTRLHNKAFLELNGKPTIYWLIMRLLKSEYDLVIAIPEGDQIKAYVNAEFPDIKCIEGDKDNVLNRMLEVSSNYDYIIRVTYDDLFIDMRLMGKMARFANKKELDYCFLALCPEGVGSDIFKRTALDKANNLHGDLAIEGVSNYFRNDDYRWDEYRPSYEYQYQYRVTLDYPKDYLLIKILGDLMHGRPSDWDALDLVHFLKKNRSLRSINKLPKVSIYITNYNYGDYLQEAIESALNINHDSFEVVVIDDLSTDNSRDILIKYIDKVNIIFNDTNIGLPASANKAISTCRGEYIMRIDADDKVLPEILNKLLGFFDNNKDVGMVFPGYLDANHNMEVQKEVLPPFDINENESHPTGCLIDRRCYNDIKYDEKLKGFESYKFMKEFNQRFNVGYHQEALWVKRTHKDGMMHNNLEEREKIKDEIDNN